MPADDQRSPMLCGPSADQVDRHCGSLLTHDTHEPHSLLAPGERLTPWMIQDLPRIAWIVEYRAAELTDEERQLVRDATNRMLRALEHDTG